MGEPERTVDILQAFLETGRPGHSVIWKDEMRQCRDCLDFFNARVAYVDEAVRHVPELCPACSAAALFEEQKAEALVKLAAVTRVQRERWDLEAGCPARFKSKTFEDFDRRRQPRAYKALTTWQPPRSIILSSADLYGVGKTHLACALLNRVLAGTEPAWLTRDLWVQARRCPVHFTSEPHLLASIRATYQEGSTETDDLIFRRLASFDLLILDDVGKTKPRDPAFLQGVYFRVIDDRYSGGKPIVLTTNLSLTELEAHIGGSCADRLYEMCGPDNIIQMRGRSYRVNGG